jgi:truncated hemoglobin YjbI
MSTAMLHYGANERRHIMLQKLGGKEVLQKATDTFYDRQMNDKMLAKFFHGSDLTILKWHQFNLMGIAFTQVPDNFDVEHLILVRHEHLFDRGLDETYFDHTVELFVQTLQELKVDPELIEEAKTVIMPLRKYFEEGAELARQRQLKQAKEEMIGQVVLLSVVALCAISAAKLMKQISRKH